jgi:hypothetical protein
MTNVAVTENFSFYAAIKPTAGRFNVVKYANSIPQKNPYNVPL